MELADPGLELFERRGPGQVDDEWPHLRSQEVVGARRPELGEPGHRLASDEVEDDVAVGVVPHLRAIRGRQSAQQREERRGTRPALGLRQRLATRHDGPEGIRSAVLGDELLGGADDVERVPLGLLRAGAPGRDAVPAEDHADRIGPLAPDRRDVEPQLEPRSSPRGPRDAVAERLPRQRFAVRSRRERDPGVGMEVVDMGRVDQSVHRGVDRRCGAAASEQAVVERRDHLVFLLDAGVDVDERPETIEPEDRQAGLGERAEIAARTLDPQQLDRSPGDRIDGAALGRRVAAGVVRVLRVGPESMRTLEEIGDGVARRSGRRRDVRRHGVGASARARRRRARAAADGRIRTGLTWRLPASAPDRRESHLGAIGERGIGAGRR